jgi:hypothetical protein
MPGLALRRSAHGVVMSLDRVQRFNEYAESLLAKIADLQAEHARAGASGDLERVLRLHDSIVRLYDEGLATLARLALT